MLEALAYQPALLCPCQLGIRVRLGGGASMLASRSKELAPVCAAALDG